MQVIAGEFIVPNPSPARFTDLDSSCLVVPWGCAGGAHLHEAPAWCQFPFKTDSVQAALVQAGGRQVSGALEGSWLVCLPGQISFADSVWAGKDAGVTSLEMRSWLREQEVSQALSSPTGGPHTPSQQEWAGILSQVQAGLWEGPLLTSHCLPFLQSDTQLQIKMMRMLIEKAALELQQILPSHPLKSRFPDKELCQSLVK